MTLKLNSPDERSGGSSAPVKKEPLAEHIGKKRTKEEIAANVHTFLHERRWADAISVITDAAGRWELHKSEAKEWLERFSMRRNPAIRDAALDGLKRLEEINGKRTTFEVAGDALAYLRKEPQEPKKAADVVKDAVLSGELSLEYGVKWLTVFANSFRHEYYEAAESALEALESARTHEKKIPQAME